MKFIFNFILLYLFSSTLAHADHESGTESSPDLKGAFYEINDSLYELYARRDICNKRFPDFIKRNNEAYEEWELQYSFFLKDFDNKYFDWKKGFSQLQQQQLAVLESIHRHKVAKRTNKYLEDGARDKCYTFKPSLGRPRNNLELNHQEAVNLIRLKANQNFQGTRNATGIEPLCAWQQTKAIEISNKFQQNISEDQQEDEQKAYKKADTDLGRKQHKARIRAYDDMIEEVYEFPQLHTDTYSIFKLTQCQMEAMNIETEKLKKIDEELIKCQSSFKSETLLLSRCISEAIPER